MQLPSFFSDFDPRAAAANLPSSDASLHHCLFPIKKILICISLCFIYSKIISFFCRLFYVMSGVQAYLAGLTFALAASPCSTPVLATLLGYVATSRVCIIEYIVVAVVKSLLLLFKLQHNGGHCQSSIIESLIN